MIQPSLLNRSARRSAVAGFTLIEMLVVVAIMVVLSGYVLAKLDRAQLKSNKGVAASNMGGVSRYIQTYRVMHNAYPDRWDSLVTPAGALVAPGAPGGAPGIDPQLTGGPPAGSPAKLSTTTLSLLEARSLTRLNIGTVLDWDAAADSAPGDRFRLARLLIDDAGTPGDPTDDTPTGIPVATLNWTPTGAVGPGVGNATGTGGGTGEGDAAAIIDHIYPGNKVIPGPGEGAIPAGKKLVVFGFGPANQAIGDVLQECPTYANTDPTQYYNRNLAIFEVDDGGSRAELKAVVGGDADRIDEEVADFYEK